MNGNITGKEKGLYFKYFCTVSRNSFHFLLSEYGKWVTSVNKVYRYVPIDSSTMFSSVTQARVYYGTPYGPRCCMSVGCILLVVDVSAPPNI